MGEKKFVSEVHSNTFWHDFNLEKWNQAQRLSPSLVVFLQCEDAQGHLSVARYFGRQCVSPCTDQKHFVLVFYNSDSIRPPTSAIVEGSIETVLCIVAISSPCPEASVGTDSNYYRSAIDPAWIASQIYFALNVVCFGEVSRQSSAQKTMLDALVLHFLEFLAYVDFPLMNFSMVMCSVSKLVLRYIGPDRDVEILHWIVEAIATAEPCEQDDFMPHLHQSLSHAAIILKHSHSLILSSLGWIGLTILSCPGSWPTKRTVMDWSRATALLPNNQPASTRKKKDGLVARWVRSGLHAWRSQTQLL